MVTLAPVGKDEEKQKPFKVKSLFGGLPLLRDVYMCLRWDESEDGLLGIEYERWGRSDGPVLVAWQSRVHPTLSHFCPCC